MVVNGNCNCEDVWREVSNYLDGEVEPGLRVAIEEHVHGCARCTAVVAGVRNVVELYGDERMLDVPFGYSQRLHQRLDENMPANRRSFLGWMLAAAAACLIVGTVEVNRLSSARDPQLAFQHPPPGNGVPPALTVVVAEDAILFHAPGCGIIPKNDKLRTMTADKATQDGYTPCVQCLKKYLEST